MSAPLIPPRPLGVGDLFNATFAIYRRNFGQFILISLLPNLISLIVVFGVIGLFIIALIPMIISLTSYGDYGSMEAGVGLLIAAGAALVVGSVLTVVAGYTSTGLISLGVVQVNRGLAPTAGSLWRDSRGLMGRSLGLVGVGFIAGLALVTIFGLLLGLTYLAQLDAWLLILPLIGCLIVLPIVAQARLGLIGQVLGIEGRGALDTVRSCWQLTRGSGARIFGLLFLASLLINVVVQSVSSAVQGISGAFSEVLFTAGGSLADPETILLALAPMAFVGSAVTFAAGVVAQPFMAIYSSVLYVDQLRRKQAQTGQPLFA